MSSRNPKPGERGGAPFKTPGKNTVERLPTETIVALRGQLKQLTSDLESIATGQAGSTFAKGEAAKLKRRIAAVKSKLMELDASSARGNKG